MASSTRGSLSAPRKRTASRKKCLNEEITVKPKIRLVNKAHFTHPEDMEKAVPESPSEPNELFPEPIEDVSAIKFTLSWSLLLDSVEIDSDSELLILGEFNYREFNANAIKTMARATAKAKIEYEYIKGSAALGAKGVVKVNERPLTINDEDGWKKAESFIESFMREKRMDIILSFAMKFAKVCNDDNEESEDENRLKKKRKKVHLYHLQN